MKIHNSLEINSIFMKKAAFQIKYFNCDNIKFNLWLDVAYFLRYLSFKKCKQTSS
jgi:hypothetical protein